MDQVTRTPSQLGAALRRYRKKRELTQLDLGNRVHKRQATVSNLEAVGNGTIDTLFAVLSALDLELVVRPRTKSAATQLGDVF
jgi:HTH-type transcriptional regulator/antitoxin HipB